MLEPLSRVTVERKDVFGGTYTIQGLVTWVRDDLCGVLLDFNSSEEVFKTAEVKVE